MKQRLSTQLDTERQAAARAAEATALELRLATVKHESASATVRALWSMALGAADEAHGNDSDQRGASTHTMPESDAAIFEQASTAVREVVSAREQAEHALEEVQATVEVSSTHHSPRTVTVQHCSTALLTECNVLGWDGAACLTGSARTVLGYRAALEGHR